MIDISKGRYWDEGITLVDGCTPCSPGCDHCWSASMTHRFNTKAVTVNNTSYPLSTNKGFTGEIICHPEYLKRFNTRKPKVFATWNDLFHEDVPVEFILNTFRTIGGQFQNTYLILTKRPQRMWDVIESMILEK